MNDDVRGEVRRLILDEFLPGEDPENLLDDTPLRTSGILDSMATIRLTTFLEGRYGIRIEAHETGVEHFDTVADIVHLVASKMNATKEPEG
jgi:acyl carrier protein